MADVGFLLFDTLTVDTLPGGQVLEHGNVTTGLHSLPRLMSIDAASVMYVRVNVGSCRHLCHFVSFLSSLSVTALSV